MTTAAVGRIETFSTNGHKNTYDHRGLAAPQDSDATGTPLAISYEQEAETRPEQPSRREAAGNSDSQKVAAMLELECLMALGVLLSVSLVLMFTVRPKLPQVRLRQIPIND
ncbi:MAG: hypothetical protein KF708_02815 [Pirellulales bacterium]|nr:hypothetical protein [Pirellulales bacterium]